MPGRREMVGWAAPFPRTPALSPEGRGSIGGGMLPRFPLPGGERVRVRGQHLLRQSVRDCLKHAFGILQNFMVPEADDPVARQFKKTIPSAVSYAAGMLTAIDFNDKLLLFAKKIDDIRPHRNLAAKFGARKLSTTEIAPKLPLRVGHSPAEMTRIRETRRIHLSHCHPHPGPLPQGRGNITTRAPLKKCPSGLI